MIRERQKKGEKLEYAWIYWSLYAWIVALSFCWCQKEGDTNELMLILKRSFLFDMNAYIEGEHIMLIDIFFFVYA